MTEKEKQKEEAREVKLEEKLVVEAVKEAATKKAEAPAEIKEEIKEKEGDTSKSGSIHKEERVAIAYIYSSSNNTLVHITDLSGNTLSRVSGGMITKHSRLKSNPTTAMFVAKKAAERARDLGITSLYIRSRAKTNSTGLGPGGHAAIKTLGKEGFRIISLLDTTKVPRGGPKKKGGKRGRRV